MFPLCLWVEDHLLTWPSFTMRVLIKLGLVRFCAFVYVPSSSLPSSTGGVGVGVGVCEVAFGLFISCLRLMCKYAKSDCIIMQMSQHNILLMNYSDTQGEGTGQKQCCLYLKKTNH